MNTLKSKKEPQLGDDPAAVLGFRFYTALINGVSFLHYREKPKLNGMQGLSIKQSCLLFSGFVGSVAGFFCFFFLVFFVFLFFFGFGHARAVEQHDERAGVVQKGAEDG